MTRPLRRALLCSLLFVAAPLAAQVDPVALEDEATSARGYWRAAAQALEGGDSLLALARLDSATRAWPMQAAYHRAAARLAARVGRSDRAFQALEALTILGSAWSSDDAALVLLNADPRFGPAAERNRLATAPLTLSRVQWTVDDSTLLVEGVAADSASGRLFVSAVRGGRILVRSRSGQVSDFIRPGDHGAGAILGMVVDPRRKLLWVTSADTVPGGEEYPEFGGGSALYAFDLATGGFRARVELPAVEGGHQLGDVIITQRGTLFASDSRTPAVYRIPAGPIPAQAEVAVAGSPAFRNLQGMAVSEDELTLYLADYSHGLLRVDLPTGQVVGLPAPGGQTLLGIDGLADGGRGRLIGVQNGIAPVRVIAIDLDRSGTRVTGIEVLDRPELAPGEATLGVRIGNSFVYVTTQPAALRSLPLSPR
jgi:sugar lactone lactonase YvrE